MYMILGRFKQNPQVDLFRYVAPTTEDYMWLKVIETQTCVLARLLRLCDVHQLTLVWESEDKLPDWLRDNQSLTLLHLQESKRRLGIVACRPGVSPRDRC